MVLCFVMYNKYIYILNLNQEIVLLKDLKFFKRLAYSTVCQVHFLPPSLPSTVAKEGDNNVLCLHVFVSLFKISLLHL